MRKTLLALASALLLTSFAGAFPVFSDAAAQLDGVWLGDDFALKVDAHRAQVRALVDEVNEKRRQIYEKRAADQNVPVDQVGRVYAEQIFRDAAEGVWFLTESGNWIQN